MTGENDATAEMPGEDALIFEIVSHSSKPYGEKSARNAARAILDLFAPKTEKPPTQEDDAASTEIAVQSQPRIGAKRAEPILPPPDEIGHWQARALAAEAALAAERERFEAMVRAYEARALEEERSRLEAAAPLSARETARYLEIERKLVALNARGSR